MPYAASNIGISCAIVRCAAVCGMSKSASFRCDAIRRRQRRPHTIGRAVSETSIGGRRIIKCYVREAMLNFGPGPDSVCVAHRNNSQTPFVHYTYLRLSASL